MLKYKGGLKTEHHKIAGVSFPALVCSIFSLGTVTHESVVSFAKAVELLADVYFVRDFFITLDSCYPEYLERLKEFQNKYNEKVKITLITHYSAEANLTNSKFFGVFPPCNNVENIDTKAKYLRTQNIRVIKTLIDRSDFCICNLDGTIFAERIKKFVRKAKKVIMLDLSRTVQDFTKMQTKNL